jgi:hypothetical protein
MEKLTAKEISVIRSETELALKKVGEKYGVKFEFGNIRYNETAFHCTLKGILKSSNSNGVVFDKRNENKARFALRHFGVELPIVLIGSLAEVKNLGPCRIKDFNSRASRFPIVVETHKTGKTYKTSIESIQKFLAK